MCRHLFLVMIEAQNKSCNLGYIQPSMVYLSTCTALTPTPVLKLGGGDELEGRNLESELYVFSQVTKNLLDSSEKKNAKLFTMFVNQNILARAYTDKILKTLSAYAFTNKPLWFARRLLDRKKEEGVGVFQAFLSSPSLISKALV